MGSAYRKLALSLIMMAALLAGGVMIAQWLAATRPMAQRSDIAVLPPLVKVHKVVPRDIQEVLVGYGSARADVQVRLTAQVGGVVVEVAEGLKDGSEVVEGGCLVRIDDRDYRQELARAESLAAEVHARTWQLNVEKENVEKLLAISNTEVGVNRDELTRLANLFEESQASKREVDIARLTYQRSRREWQGYKNLLALIEPRRASLEATRRALRADAELARLRIEKCRIIAPFTGQVQRISVDVGDSLQPGSEILHLISTRLIEVPIELPASVRPRVVAGAKCVLNVESMSGVSWEGRVSRLSPVIDVGSRTITAYIEVDNDEQVTPLVPGCFLTAQVAGPVFSKVLAVPRGAIIDDYLYVANDDVAHARTVQIERLIDEQAVVSGDLKAGDLVILTNLDKLFDGASVRVQVGRPISLEMENPFSTPSDRSPRSKDAGHPADKADPVLSEHKR